MPPPVSPGTLQYSRGGDRVERARGLSPEQRLESLNAVVAVFFIPLVLLAIVVLILVVAL